MRLVRFHQNVLFSAGMSRKRHAESEDGSSSGRVCDNPELNRIGDLEGETLAAVRAACRRSHLPLPTSCLAYSLFKIAKPESNSLNSKLAHGSLKNPAILNDQEAELMQFEIKSKLEKSLFGDSSLGSRKAEGAGTSRFVALIERHTFTGQCRYIRFICGV